MPKPSFKLMGLTVAAVALTAGSAFAGNGKNCDHKKTTAMKSEAAMTSTAPTAVLSTSEQMGKKSKKVMSFDAALDACVAKKAADLQACIDYKTGAVKPKS